MTPGNVSPSELAKVNGSNASFQPFNGSAGAVQGGGKDQFLSPANLRTPESDPLNALPTMSPFPAYHSTQPVPQTSTPDVATEGGDKEDFRALDELTSRVGQVALGLDDEQPKRVESNGKPTSPAVGEA